LITCSRPCANTARTAFASGETQQASGRTCGSKARFGRKWDQNARPRRLILAIVLVKTPAERVAETLGKPFQPGNPRGPRGAPHKATIAAEALLDGEAEGLTRKAIEAALGGDTAALRLCIDGIVPLRRE